MGFDPPWLHEESSKPEGFELLTFRRRFGHRGRYPARRMRIDTHTLTRLRRDLMRRGATLATLLSEVLAGKAPPQIAALLAQKPGLRPEEVLRLALDQIERRRCLIDDDDDRYGRCDACGVDLGAAALAEMPWADRCAAHASM